MNISISNYTQQLDNLSDLLTDSCFSVACKKYQDMTPDQQKEVKRIFFSLLKSNNIQVTAELIDQAQKVFKGSPIASFLREYFYHHYSIFENALQQLTQGRKVTIIKYSDIGYPIMFHTVIDKAIVEPWAQYKETLKIVHKLKRKRSLYANRILPNESLLIFDEWLDIDFDKLIYNVTKSDNHITVKETKYYSFDNKLFFDVINTVQKQPIVSLNIN